MKAFAIVFLILGLCAANKYEEFVQGFLEGIRESHNVKDLEKCLGDLSPIIKMVTEALELFKKMTYDDIKSGIEILHKALEQLYTMLQPCLKEFNNLKKLIEKMKEAKDNIMKIIMKILFNPGKYISLCTKIIECLKKQDLHGGGYGIGDLLYSLFLTRNMVNDVNPIIDFMAGFLRGIHENKTIFRFRQRAYDSSVA